jgi:hypothetical protein
VRGLEPRLKLTGVELYERRLVSGGALSTTFMAMHAANFARHLADGEIIAPASFMDSADTGWFEPIFSRGELISSGLPDTISARLLGNVLLVDRSKTENRTPPPLKQWILDADDAGNAELLSSQFIDHSAVIALRQDDPKAFMFSRAALMKSMAEELVGTTAPVG